MKLVSIAKDVRVIVLFIVILFAIFAINPLIGERGVAIRGVERNSTAFLAGIENPEPNSAPRSKERIIAINTIPVSNLDD